MSRAPSFPPLALALALALALVAPGCTFLRSEGDESLVVRNSAGEPLRAIISITQRDGGIRTFGEDIPLLAGQQKEFPLVMRKGIHDMSITTTTSISESFAIEIPSHGDTTLDLTIRRGAATFTQTSR